MIKFKKISKKIFMENIKLEKVIKDMLELLGENPEREGLQNAREGSQISKVSNGGL